MSKRTRNNGPELSRRAFVGLAGGVAAAAAAKPVATLADEDMVNRIAHAIAGRHRVDISIAEHVEAIIDRCRQQGDLLGPQIAFENTMAQRQMVSGFLRDAPSQLRSRIQVSYAELCRMAGWESFNLGKYAAAYTFYEEACKEALAAGQFELASYFVSSQSQLATWTGDHFIGTQLAEQARKLAERSGHPGSVGYAWNVAGRAFAASGREKDTKNALDAEFTESIKIDADKASLNPRWNFYGTGFYWSLRTKCMLDLGDPDEALASSIKSMPLLEAPNVHDFAFTSANQSQAYLQMGEIDHACSVLGDVVVATRINRAPRIKQRVVDIRAMLQPWAKTRAVREFDEQLTTMAL